MGPGASASLLTPGFTSHYPHPAGGRGWFSAVYFLIHPVMAVILAGAWGKVERAGVGCT